MAMVSTDGAPVPVTVTTQLVDMAADVTHRVVPLTPGGEIYVALLCLREAERKETCDFCRSHITATRVLLEDLVAVADMGDDLRKHEELRRLSLRLGEVGESIGGLAVIARVIHRVKGLR